MTRTIRIQAAAALALITILPVQAGAAAERAVSSLERTLVEVAADSIDTVLTAVADSTRALGDMYRRLAAAQASGKPIDPERWLESRTTRGNTTGVRTWPADIASTPAFQAPYPAFYSYSGDQLSESVLREFDLFERSAAALRAAYESFPFSWVYLTTSDDAMAIYPYVPIEQAVHNGTPTKNEFYQAADFERQRVGWTTPYLDLVGAGMMVTASYPIYDGDRLLGVASRDITLKQLSRSILSRLGRGGSIALIVDGSGLAIDASEPTLADEIDRVNTKAQAAALYYRTAEGLEGLAGKHAVPSADDEVNALVEAALAKVGAGDNGPVDLDGKRALAARIENTGWLLILLRPSAGEPARQPE